MININNNDVTGGCWLMLEGGSLAVDGSDCGPDDCLVLGECLLPRGLLPRTGLPLLQQLLRHAPLRTPLQNRPQGTYDL